MTEAGGMTEAANPLEEIVRQYYHDPVGFVYDKLEAIPDEWQCLVMEDVANGERRISIKSGHGVGKSTVLSWLLIWFVVTRFPCKAVVTAPTQPQLFDALFAELKTWIKKMPPWLNLLFEVKSDRVELKAAPESAFVTARTSRAEQPEALQGVHAEHVFLVVDEASGVPDKVYEAGSGSMSGHNATTLLAGNPVRSSGYFYDTHNKNAHRWRCYTVSCLDSSRVSPEYIEEMRESYGEESNVYRVRVLGLFPLTDDNTIIPLELVDAARSRDIVPPHNATTVWGLDVARFGDDTSVLTKRRGPVYLPQTRWRKLDLMQLTGAVKAEWDATALPERPRVILVDVIGLGAGVVDRLRELGLPVRGINVAEAPAVGKLYRNLRAELWFRAKAWFEARGGRIPDDEKLANQLAAVQYKFTSSGLYQVESKQDMRKRGLRSPDDADSFILTFADEAAVGIHGGRSIAWNKPLRRNEPVV